MKTGRKPVRHNWPTKDQFKAHMKTDGVVSYQQYRRLRASGKYTQFPSCPDRTYKLVSFKDVFPDATGGPGMGRQWPDAKYFVETMRKNKVSSLSEYLLLKRNGHYQQLPGSPIKVYGRKASYLFGSVERNRGRAFMLLEDAQKIVSVLRFADSREYVTWGKHRPSFLPSQPSEFYGKEFNDRGGWPWFLGTLGSQNRWTTNSFRVYITELHNQISNLSDSEIYQILNQAGAFPAIMRTFGTSNPGQAISLLRSLSGNEVEKKSRNVSGSLSKETLELSYNADSTEDNIELTSDCLHTLDQLHVAQSSQKDLIAERKLHQLWAMAVENQSAAPAFKLLKGTGGEYFRRIKDRFTKEYKAVSGLKIPKGWSFKVRGKITPPSLMQKRVAYLLKKKRALLNLSGPGAGKTLSGILSARYLGAKLTVVVLHNPTIEGWKSELMAAYPDTRICKDLKDVKVGYRTPQYLFLNYEKFQDHGATKLVNDLVDLNPEMIIIDEVQFMKERGGVMSSQRRAALHSMVERLPESYILALTATPVINDLVEPKSLLSTVLRSESSMPSTAVNQQNALSWHFTLQEHSVRFKPNYGQKLTFIPLKATKNTLHRALLNCDNPLELEQTLLPAKLSLVKRHIKKGTVIYVQFVDGITEPIKKFVGSLGLSVGEFSGNNSDSRNDDKLAFEKGELDVLVISQAGRVGLDGLQKRASRMILIGTPWTASDMEQVIGRVYRQGSTATEVEIIHPQIFLKVKGQSWSWDEIRLESVHSKRTLAECVTDGVLMNTERVSRAELMKKARQSLLTMTALMEAA